MAVYNEHIWYLTIITAILWIFDVEHSYEFAFFANKMDYMIQILLFCIFTCFFRALAVLYHENLSFFIFLPFSSFRWKNEFYSVFHIHWIHCSGWFSLFDTKYPKKKKKQMQLCFCIQDSTDSIVRICRIKIDEYYLHHLAEFALEKIN